MRNNAKIPYSILQFEPPKIISWLASKWSPFIIPYCHANLQCKQPKWL